MILQRVLLEKKVKIIQKTAKGSFVQTKETEFQIKWIRKVFKDCDTHYRGEELTSFASDWYYRITLPMLVTMHVTFELTWHITLSKCRPSNLTFCMANFYL